MKPGPPLWRTAAGVGVLLLMAAIGVLLIPPYVENWKLQSFLNQMAQDPATAQKTPAILRANILDKAASLGLPVHTDDVRVTQSADGLKIEVLYIVRIDLPVYTVDLHFRPAA
ncbi:MAG: DUF4845 domain-containing protein [Acidobacteriota bacterium]|nr:DUF4845 domain-containing protein [Acidobacteriota bacterium]